MQTVPNLGRALDRQRSGGVRPKRLGNNLGAEEMVQIRWIFSAREGLAVGSKSWGASRWVSTWARYESWTLEECAWSTDQSIYCHSYFFWWSFDTNACFSGWLSKEYF